MYIISPLIFQFGLNLIWCKTPTLFHTAHTYIHSNIFLSLYHFFIILNSNMRKASRAFPLQRKTTFFLPWPWSLNHPWLSKEFIHLGQIILSRIVLMCMDMQTRQQAKQYVILTRRRENSEIKSQCYLHVSTELVHLVNVGIQGIRSGLVYKSTRSTLI